MNVGVIVGAVYFGAWPLAWVALVKWGAANYRQHGFSIDESDRRFFAVWSACGVWLWPVLLVGIGLSRGLAPLVRRLTK